ncbi:acetyl/propionyl/methylcrotonyl-CoA carboxylase subunit alpha [Kouleothrix sp.]|uniref:acetyl/propionyl/methylcrotonyl-CoA carboxylase subunit alpha n=1 Tax=Kouleothrix sp. TaxID=2779161 RepID=UPI00391D3A2C
MYFNTILIANRGEIAVRIIRACHELGIAAVAVYSEADAGALHVRQADAAFPIGPAAAAHSYLSAERILAAARQSGAEAIHPGYGFLSERAHFARACAAAEVVFIGPPPQAIELMGSKIAAKRLAEQAGVPTAPGYMGDDQAIERLRDEARRVGFPLLIKASAGGGGKGMRVVRSLAELEPALDGARREARAAFGDDAVFLERLIERPRHVEIQVLADAHGHCVHLFERECSIQRRHQKIIEESPSVALSPGLRAEMGDAAVRLAQAAGYVGAGTMEFMLAEDGSYYFLEMNTRLQVEHPVTEAVAGVDLVQLQIAIAAGASLPFTQPDLAQRGHAIEARVYAEDPVTFLPSIGQVALFAPPAGPGIRNDAGVETGDEVTVHYDPMLAKLIVAAPSRNAAIERLRRALAEYAVLGLTTNLPLLRAIASHPDFAAGATTTSFLADAGLQIEEEHQPVPADVLVAAAIGDVLASSPAADDVQPNPWRAGAWRPLGDTTTLRYTAGEREYAVGAARQPGGWLVTLGGTAYERRVVSARPGELILAAGAAQARFTLARDADGARLVGWRGASYRLARAAALSVDTLGTGAGRAHGHASLAAPMPGTVVKLLVEVGQAVAAQQPLVVLEAMKMEHVVVAPYDGLVQQVCYAAGALVAKGAVLVELDEAAV